MTLEEIIEQLKLDRHALSIEIGDNSLLNDPDAIIFDYSGSNVDDAYGLGYDNGELTGVWTYLSKLIPLLEKHL